MKKLAVVLIAAFALVACNSDHDDWEDRLDDIEDTLPVVVLTAPAAQVWGTELPLAFTVADPQGRIVDITVEFSFDGVNWFLAAPAAGFANPYPLDTPEGGAIAQNFTWDMFADLGVGDYPELYARVNPSSPDGTSGVSGPLEITTFTEVAAADFKADLYADFADGVLDTVALVDSRIGNSWEQDSIPGALHAPLGDIQTNGAAALVWSGGTQIPLDARLIFYCDGGG